MDTLYYYDSCKKKPRDLYRKNNILWTDILGIRQDTLEKTKMMSEHRNFDLFNILPLQHSKDARIEWDDETLKSIITLKV
jgi:hypothetical protein